MTNAHTQKETSLEIAVIGMAGRFPGAKDIDQFWENLKNGVESITFFSDQELLDAGVEPELLKNPDYVKCKGGLLEEREYFDAPVFGYSAAEAVVMDPQVGVFHECAWHALEDAGYNPFTYDGLIGLYAGATFNITWETIAILSGRLNVLGGFAGGLLIDRDYLCTRVSYNLDLKGPSMVIKTACSTSLAAVHTACQAILNGECDMALAGGVTVIRITKSGYLYQEDMIASPDGHCRAFDAQAKGTMGGDGVGVVVLKRLEDALCQRDHIYAVVKGTAVNNDGIRKAGYTAPSIQGQAEVISDAHQVAEVDPKTISYIETHGTGTTVGDPIEIEALKTAFNSDEKQYCAIGSVKTNIGHLDSAAGIASFIKTVLAVKHRFLPPSLHYQAANANIDFENSPFYVNHCSGPWQADGSPLRAGVSSFGIGGTNAHAVLEEAPPAAETSASRAQHLLLLSAKSQPALQRAAQNLGEFLENNPHIDLADAAYTLQTGRQDFDHRSMAISKDREEAIQALLGESPGKLRTFHNKEEKVSAIFMFPGLGPQYVNMGADLYRSEPLFREEMKRCFQHIKRLTHCDLKEILYPPASASSQDTDLNTIEISQLAVFSFEYALAQLLLKWGVTPHAMIGYSLGEYTAACLAGVFSLEDALRIIVTRGQLLKQLRGGLMLSVPLPAQDVSPLLGSELSLAIDNGPSCIAAGPEEAVADLEKKLKEKRILGMRLANSHAIHSKMTAPISEEFNRCLEKITLNTPRIPYISNLTGTWVSVQEALDPGYWARHLQETVRFAEGIAELKKEPNPLFIEVGPGRDLRSLLVRHQEENPSLLAVNITRPEQQQVPDDRYLLSRIGLLWLYGQGIDWQAFYSQEQRRRIPLPGYSFDRKRYWFRGNPLRDWQQMMPGRAQAADADGDTAPAAAPAKIPEVPDNVHERPPLDSEYVPSGNPTEEIIVQAWQNLFGIREIGIEDDFFDLGGDSLKAAAMLGQVNQQLELHIPLAELYNHPTAGKLAEYIAGKEQQRFKGAHERLLLFKEGTKEAKHLFFAHNGYGSVESYFELCNRLDHDFNYWGVQGDRIENWAPRNLTFEEIGANNVAKIRTVQPEGPYYIAGWCMGALFAYEIVRQLEEQNQEVKLFFVIDGPAPEWNAGSNEFDFSVSYELDWIFQSMPSEEIKQKVSGITELDRLWPTLLDYLEEIRIPIDHVRQIVPNEMREAFPNFQQLDTRELIFYLNTIRTFGRAESQYTPQGKAAAPTLLFEATDSDYMSKYNRWPEYCETILDTYHMPGDHFSIFFNDEHAASFAKVFTAALNNTL